jgi:LacI family transcriptional regulator
MRTGRRVLLMFGCSRASERGLLRGIARYARFHDPWIFDREPPFYRKPPYHRLPRQTPSSSPLQGRGLDGIVAYAANPAQIEALLPPEIPAVVLPIEEKVPGRCSIVEEDHTVGRMAAEHFLDRGFTRFAFCGFDHMYWSRVRQEGFLRRLAAAGFDAHLYEPPRPSANLAWEAEQTFMAKWLRALPKPIGLMVCNDDRAQQVIEANKAAGTRIPDEIAVLGVDNDDIICALTHPPLSSIALNFEEAGYEAAAQLDRQMKGRKCSTAEILLRPTHIHTRQSTDVLAVEDPAVAEALRFIRIHAGEVLSVQDVLDAASTSRRLLERRFRRAVGAGIYQQIQHAHVERACRMLLETNWSVAEVAARCGFSNPVHFSVAFKRRMHLTPEQHRHAAARLIPEQESLLRP